MHQSSLMGKKKKEKIGKSLRPKLTPMKTKNVDDDDDIDEDGLGFEDIALPIPIISPLTDVAFGKFNDNFSTEIDCNVDAGVIDMNIVGSVNNADDGDDLIGSSASEGTKTNEPSLNTLDSARTAATYSDNEIIKDMSMEFDDIELPPSVSLSNVITGEYNNAEIETTPEEDGVNSTMNLSAFEGTSNVDGSSMNNTDSALALPLDVPKEDQATGLSTVNDTCENEPTTVAICSDIDAEYVNHGASTNIDKPYTTTTTFDNPRDNEVALEVLNLTSSFDHDPLKSSVSSLQEVSLDSSDIQKPAAPLIRAFNRNQNGIPLSFSFMDTNESEAFVFLTESILETLGDDARGVTNETLSRYMRWKPDVERAADRWRANQAFRKKNSYIFDDGKKPLLLSQDPKLTFLLQNGMILVSEEVFAKDGSGIMLIKGAKCDITAHNCTDQDASRACFYIIQQMLAKNTFDPSKGITIILDLEGATRNNIPKSLPSLLSKAVGCFPVRIQAVYVIASSWWFPGGRYKFMFSTKLQSRVHFVKNKTALYEFIDKDRLQDVYSFDDMKASISLALLQEVESRTYHSTTKTGNNNII